MENNADITLSAMSCVPSTFPLPWVDHVLGVTTAADVAPNLLLLVPAGTTVTDIASLLVPIAALMLGTLLAGAVVGISIGYRSTDEPDTEPVDLTGITPEWEVTPDDFGTSELPELPLDRAIDGIADDLHGR